MSTKQELHDLLHNLPFPITGKELARICGVGRSSLNNHKSKNEKIWMSEKACKLALERLEMHLTNPNINPPTKGMEIVLNGSREIVSVKQGSVQQIISILVDQQTNIIRQMENDIAQAELYTKRASELKPKAEKLGLAIEILRENF
jgi:hypothetical protein